MTFRPDEPRDFHRFLDKFKILDEIAWTEELIDRSIGAVCRDIIEDRLDYVWMDFSINKYMEHFQGRHKRDVVRFVYERFQDHAPGRVGLILSLKYESSRASQRQYADLIDQEGVAECLIGIDLVGDESRFEHQFHGAILKQWREAGKIVRAHVGEYGTVENICTAIESGATNIAHGLAVVNDRSLIDIAKSRSISFDLGLTSNMLTGITTHSNHPLRAMLDAGLIITIGTDDPIVCDNDLDTEFRLCKALGASDGEIETMKTNAEQLLPAKM